MQRYGLIDESRPEVPRPSAAQVVADDTQAVVEPIEARCFELPQPIGNDAAPSTQAGREPRAAVDAEAVRPRLRSSRRAPARPPRSRRRRWRRR
jgi:hypothetical protein